MSETYSTSRSFFINRRNKDLARVPSIISSPEGKEISLDLTFERPLMLFS